MLGHYPPSTCGAWGGGVRMVNERLRLPSIKIQVDEQTGPPLQETQNQNVYLDFNFIFFIAFMLNI
jgi:hypothetical protein